MGTFPQRPEQNPCCGFTAEASSPDLMRELLVDWGKLREKPIGQVRQLYFSWQMIPIRFSQIPLKARSYNRHPAVAGHCRFCGWFRVSDCLAAYGMVGLAPRLRLSSWIPELFAVAFYLPGCSCS